MSDKYKKELTAEELAALPDSEIDYSDIPELDAGFWDKAVGVMPKFSRHEEILVFVMAALFLLGQMAGFVLNIWGFPSQWF